jgi:hypothetical protein
LRLASEGWFVLQGELDGAAWKLLDLSTNAYTRARRPCAHPDERLTLPALYSTGFTVIRTGRCDALMAQVDRSMQFEQQPADTRFVLLYADDLTRGYRIDVQRNDDPWRPLCRRVGRVTLGGVHEVPIDDEGYVKLASAALPLNADGYPIAALVHEGVFSWDGWSQVAPRPGRTILDPTDNTTLRDPNNPQVGDIQNVAPPDVDYSIATDIHVAPRTLPRLRFGDRYGLRARAVDLAGNSLELSEVLVDHAPEQQAYLRFEPVATPVLVPRAHCRAQNRRRCRAARDIFGGAQVDDRAPRRARQSHPEHGGDAWAPR